MSDLEMRITTALLSALAAVASLAIGLDVDPAVRAPVVLAALLMCPGWAFVGWIARADRSLMWAAGGALSCAASILVSMAMVRTEWWHPSGAVVALLLVSCLTLLSRAGSNRATAPVQVGRR